MVGWALHVGADKYQVPWQRVINYKGMISPHGAGFGTIIQETLLKEEGVEFDEQNRIDFGRFGWLGYP